MFLQSRRNTYNDGGPICRAHPNPMIDHQNTIVVIPARMASTRLPGKPLADIHGLPMIVHVWKRAVEANVGQVLVAAAEIEIADAIRDHGGDAIVTDPALASGTDRIAEALSLRDPQGQFRFVVNLQGDLPTIDPLSIQRCLAGLVNEPVDISTIAARIDAEPMSPIPTSSRPSRRWATSREVALPAISCACSGAEHRRPSGTISASTPTGARRLSRLCPCR